MAATYEFDAGRANQRIKPQYKSVTRNALGEEVITWNDLEIGTADHCIWAEAWPIKGREFFSANETQYAADVRFRVRYRADIQREHRIVWNSLPHDITQVIDVGAAHRTTEILATSGVRNGQ